jgi:hypothetical protein
VLKEVMVSGRKDIRQILKHKPPFPADDEELGKLVKLCSKQARTNVAHQWNSWGLYEGTGFKDYYISRLDLAGKQERNKYQQSPFPV